MTINDIPRGVRYLIGSVGVVAALILWRMFSPYSIPSIVDGLSDDAIDLWTTPYFRLGELAVTPAVLVKALVFVLLAALFTKIVRFVLRNWLAKLPSVDAGKKFALERGVGYLLFTFFVIVGLQSAGVDFSSLAVLGGAVGIGVGFGLQSIAKNFVSGLILLLERPIKVGDRVQVEALQGDVIHIGTRGTWVRTNDNVVMIVPNSEFIENRVTNWTANDRQVRIVVPLGVSYDSNPAEVRDLLLDVARSHQDVMNHPPPDVIFIGFGDSSLDFELRVWTTKQVQTPKIISSDLYFAIFEAFGKNDIEIPFPQRDLHIRSTDVPLGVSGTTH